MPGYDCSRFVGSTKQQLDELLCGICREIVCQPIVVQCCQQLFCTDCIKEWLDKQTTCPYDRKQLTSEQLTLPPRILVNLLSNLKIKCDFSDKGCPLVTTVQLLAEHTANCPYNVQQCRRCLSNYTTGAQQPSEHNCLKSMTELNHKTNAEINILMNIIENLSKCNLREITDNELSDDVILANHIIQKKLRKLMGTLGTVGKLLELIDGRVLKLICDDVMMAAWGTLWNITDENESNCQRFITNNGLDNFLACRQSFPDNQDLLSRMMGVLANVAESRKLRPKLLTENYLDIFLQLLSLSDLEDSSDMDIPVEFGLYFKQHESDDDNDSDEDSSDDNNDN
ncbi:protein zyg-11 homolog A-like [Oppia nitens]|uniref:protein zyg-11 homolog A-like n=1 Tax=Oppia nitens TaxID=1686743 RepID=UPI0023DC2842|nr:protein zyg-11 homolog A-like [Oppia nitens]